MKEIFVTGASGFVGQTLVESLCRSGYRPRVLVRKNSNRSFLDTLTVDYVEGDLRQVESFAPVLKQVDTVFLVGGLVRAMKNEEFFQVNQLSCRSIAEELLRLEHPPKIVYVSSLAAVGEGIRLSRSERKERGVRYLPLEETAIPHPFSTYGKSKLAAEKEWIRVCDRISVTIIRPSIVFGPRDQMTLPLFNMAQKSPVFLLPGYRSFPYSYIFSRDLVHLLIAAAQRGESLTPESLTPREDGTCSGKGIYFAAHPDAPYYKEFGRMLYEAVGRSPYRAFPCPPVGLLGAGLVMEMTKRLTKIRVSLDWEKAREALGGPWYCSGQKGFSDLGVEPLGTLQEELTQTAQWYQAEGWLK